MALLRALNPFSKRTPLVAVVRLHGVIGMVGGFGRSISMEKMAPVLEQAFRSKRVSAVALVINSPGGSPVQADLIQKRVRDLSREKDKPVFAFCEDVAASGGYWIALAANEIWANPASIVGSIGVISSGFGFHEALERLGIERRVHATGDAKGMLDPFRPEKPEHVERLKDLQGDIQDSFIEWVRERRGSKLTGAPDEVFSGAFWTGKRAKALGLVDGLGEIRTVMRARYGEDVRFRAFGERKSLFQMLGGGGRAADTVLDGLVARIEERTIWGRYGL